MTQMAKHEELPIPIHNTLDAVYGDSSQLDEAQLRFHQLKSKFQQVGHPPHLFARSSGRVNLIGEHIDYERYSMLPMAIRQDTVVAIRKHDDGDAAKVLRIANVNDKYQICTYPADPTQEIDLKNHIGALFHLWLTKPYAADSTPGQDDCADEKPSVKIPEIAGKVESGIRSPGLQCMSPDYDTKEIKNIYVDWIKQVFHLSGVIVTIFVT
nr:galactokinase-like isoform X2 [Malus domestica]